MRIRWIAGSVGVLALVAGAATLAQQQRAKEPLTLGWRAAQVVKGDHPTGKVDLGAIPPSGDSPLPVPQSRPMADEDPMNGVEAFLTRNRKEADDSIQALTAEAEVLRARLAKVEAALGRWQAIAGALAPEVRPVGESAPAPRNTEIPKDEMPKDVEPDLNPIPAPVTPSPTSTPAPEVPLPKPN